MYRDKQGFQIQIFKHVYTALNIMKLMQIIQMYKSIFARKNANCILNVSCTGSYRKLRIHYVCYGKKWMENYFQLSYAFFSFDVLYFNALFDVDTVIQFTNNIQGYP